jgi:hypothetical protein
MNGKIIIQIEGKDIRLWFNNYTKIEIANKLLPMVSGMPPRPEEELLIEAINKIAKENYMLLLKIIVNAGVKGQAYATDKPLQIAPEKVSVYIAEAANDDIYTIWVTFLQAFGFDLLLNDKEADKSEDHEKKKKTVKA